MKVKVIVYGNSKQEILFNDYLDLIESEYAIVKWPKDTENQHPIWDHDNQVEFIPVEKVDINKTYFFFYDD